MSAEDNKALARRIAEEVWSKGNTDAIDEFFAQDYIDHSPAPGYPPDRNGLKQWVRAIHDAAPDLNMTVDEVVAEGDMVVTRWTNRGTHKGEFMGVPATNKQVQVPGISMARIEDGRVKEDWAQWDALGLLQQLGALPDQT